MVVYHVGKKLKKGRKEAEPSTSKVPAVTTPLPRIPAMYGWVLRSEYPTSVAATPTHSHVPTSRGHHGAASVTSGRTSVTTAKSKREDDECVGGSGRATHEDSSMVDNICEDRRRQVGKKRKVKVRYAPPAENCPFVSCGPTKPLRTFREKPDSCLPRRK